jgi:hypothetical protein
MSNEPNPRPKYLQYLGFILTLLLGIFTLVFNPRGDALIVVLIVVGLAGFGVLMQSYSYRNKETGEMTSPNVNDKDYPDLNSSFTYRSNRPRTPVKGKTPLSYPSTDEKLPEWITHVRGHSVFNHAQKALKAADQPIDTSKPMPVDLGFLVYRGDAKPNIHRTLDIPKDADTMQPYVQLHVPVPSLFTGLTGQVRFEIRSSLNKMLFSYEQEVTLKDGLNLITPPARLPLRDVEYGQYPWELHISLGDTLLARHAFEWSDSLKSSQVAENLDADGEISDALRKLVAEQSQESLTLDELLIDQEDTPSNEQKRPLS